MQLIPGTTLGHQVAAACAEIEGVSIEEHVMQRYGSILRPAQVGEQVAELLGDPRYMQGVAYGFRKSVPLEQIEAFNIFLQEAVAEGHVAQLGEFYVSKVISGGQ